MDQPWNRLEGKVQQSQCDMNFKQDVPVYLSNMMPGMQLQWRLDCKGKIIGSCMTRGGFSCCDSTRGLYHRVWGCEGDPGGSVSWGLYMMCTCSAIKNTDYSVHLKLRWLCISTSIFHLRYTGLAARQTSKHLTFKQLIRSLADVPNYFIITFFFCPILKRSCLMAVKKIENDRY